MDSFIYYASVWLATAIPVWIGAWWLGRKIDSISESIKNMKHVTACGKPVKKKVLHGNN